MDRHLHTLSIPEGRVMYTHHELDAIADGTDRFLSDGYLIRRDGSRPVALTTDALLHLIATWGSGDVVRMTLVPRA